ncbi:hypothetical protein UFOVP657_36 [uncultured Caudovirales phage]|uniref:Uncharacterized protein n=1 Tax=uncultured Caudovirales phage TaxID=2100421 RepID=A0A6J5MDD7_9CAUD|nr:hypothetical protein UFOVP467_75 [uncultured Caudovirales phage]CAB4156075.1 hypothetical protein UFOVP657_36 [uncultured Caudovirales phage]
MSDELVYIGSIPDAVNVTDVGLEFRRDIEYDQWLTLMATLQQLSTAFQFAIGDALNYGQKRYGEKYAQAMDATGCAYQSLANWSWVATNVPIDNRIAGLSWTHHRLVAHVGTSEQKLILESAKSRGLSVTDFEKELKGEPEEEKKPLKQINIPEGWTVDDANKALEIVSSYRQGLERLTAALDAEDSDTKVQRYCAECPYNN